MQQKMAENIFHGNFFFFRRNLRGQDSLSMSLAGKVRFKLSKPHSTCLHNGKLSAPLPRVFWKGVKKQPLLEGEIYNYRCAGSSGSVKPEVQCCSRGSKTLNREN
jgi:hypothetical protein